MHKLPNRLFLWMGILWLVATFLLNPHYVEMTGVLETWFPFKGLTYYKDFAAYHFPLGRLVLLPIHLLTNWNLQFDPFLGLIMGIGTLIIIFLFGKRFLTPTASTIALIFFSVFFWYVGTGILFFHEIMIGFLVGLIILLLFNFFQTDKFSLKKIFIIGLLITLTELTGQVATLTLLAILAVLITRIWTNKLNIIKSLFYVGLGLVIPFLVISAYFFSKNAVGEFYYYNINYYLYYADYTKDSLLSLPLLKLFTFYLPLLVLGIFVSTEVFKKKTTDKNILLVLILSVSTIPAIFFSIYHPHHLNYALPILSIAAGFAYDYSKSFKFGKRIFLSGSFFFTIVFLTLILNWHLSRLVFPPNFKISNDLYLENTASIYNLVELAKRKIILLFTPEEIANYFYFQDSQIATPYALYTNDHPIHKTVEWLKENTTEQEKIMVMGDPLIYLRSNRLPSLRSSKSIPYGWEPTIVKKEIESNRPDYWVISRQFLQQLIDNNNRADIVDFVNQELKSCYQPKVKRLGMEIWKKRCL